MSLFQLGLLQNRHSFFTSPLSSYPSTWKRLLRKIPHCHLFSQKREIILKINSTFPSTGSIGNHSIPLTVFPLKSANKDTESLTLLEKAPQGLRTKSKTDTRQIHSASPVKIQADPRKPLPNIRQYPLNLEAIAGIKPIREECKA